MTQNSHKRNRWMPLIAFTFMLSGAVPSSAHVNSEKTNYPLTTDNSIAVDGGTVSGDNGDTEFITLTGDGKPDVISFVNSTTSRDNYIYLITDADGNILTTEQSSHDFEGASVGICKVYGLSFTGNLAIRGKNVKDSGLSTGEYSVSLNAIVVDRQKGEVVDGGTVSTDDNKTDVVTITGDGQPDIINFVKQNNATGTYLYIITDENGRILTTERSSHDFEGSSVGICKVYGFSYTGRPTLARKNIADSNLSTGEFSVSSNAIIVDRQAKKAEVDGGTLEGGPFSFCVDGEVDTVSGLSLSGNSGTNSTFVITDDQLNILGLPPTLDAVEGVDFDGAGAGTCLIWHLSFEDGLENAEVGKNAADLVGTFDLSNSVTVERNKVEGGELAGGPFEFAVDGIPDFVENLSISGSSGANSTYVITDDQLNILGLPPTLEAVEDVNFDDAGAGTCLIWHLSFGGDLQNAEVGKNAADLEGCFDLSNSITVVRNGDVGTVSGGELSGGPFTFCVDGEVDNVSGLSLSGNSGTNSTFVITDDKLNILGLPPTLEAVEGVDFDGAGAGTCLIWHLSFEDGLQNAEVGKNAADLEGIFDLSNSITVERNQVEGGELAGGPFEFTVDGEVDNVSGLSLSGNSGVNSTYVITDDKLNILGLPPTLEAVEGVDFDGAGAGTCLIWHLSFAGDLQNAEVGKNAADLEGCFDLSNSITVVRNEDTIGDVDGGTLEGGSFSFCVDGEVDNVSGLSLSGNSGANSTYVITDDQLNILGLPPTLDAVEGVDFDGAGAGTCLIWHLSFEDGLQNAEVGKNAADLEGIFDLSNSISVERNQVEGGELAGGPFEFTIDGEVDNVSGLSLSGNSGANSTYVITDDKLNILGLPPTLEAVEGVDFDGAGAGTCLIWHLSFAGDLQNAEVGKNAADLEGCFDLSNSITVVRNGSVTDGIDGGVLTGGPFEFCGRDGMADMVKDITLTGANGSKSAYILTTESGRIIGATRSLDRIEQINFERAYPGTYLLYHISYEKVRGVRRGRAISDLTGEFDLSNTISITKNAVHASYLFGRTQYFKIDGKPDFVKRIFAFLGRGSNSSFIITDDKGNILGLPPTLDAVKAINFDEAGPGTCLIWNIRYEDGLSGLEVGKNTSNLEGCYDLSRSIKVIRRGANNNKNIDLTNDDNLQGMSVVAYPQPATNALWLTINKGNSVGNVRVKMNDLLGNQLFTNTFSKNEDISIDVNQYPTGIYMITILDPESGVTAVKQIVIKH